MGYRDLYVTPALAFANSPRDFEGADYVVIGFPFDGTSTHRPGSRFAPNAIREASLRIEPYSMRARTSVNRLRMSDLGNVDVTLDVGESLRRLQLVVREVLDAGKVPVVLGGEHTLTLGVARALEDRATIVDFDAHADLRDEFMGRRVCHATVLRRILDLVGAERVLLVGVRALCEEEVGVIEEGGMPCTTMLDILRNREGAMRKIGDAAKRAEALYLTIDLDVMDPSFAPAVASPEPGGMDMHALLDLIGCIPGNKIVGLDVVEAAPPYDRGRTALTAARILFEVLCGAARGR